MLSIIKGRIATRLVNTLALVAGGGSITLNQVFGFLEKWNAAHQTVKESVQADDDMSDAEAKEIIAKRRASKSKREVERIKAESKYKARLEAKYDADYSAWLVAKEFYETRSVAARTAKLAAIQRITELKDNLINLKIAVANHRFDLKGEYDAQQDKLAQEYDAQISVEHQERNEALNAAEEAGAARPPRTRTARLY
jgi:hypothetical protein